MDEIIARICVAAVVIVMFVIAMIIRLNLCRKNENTAIEEESDDFIYGTQELGNNMGVRDIGNIAEDPFADDFKEQEFLLNLNKKHNKNILHLIFNVERLKIHLS